MCKDNCKLTVQRLHEVLYYNKDTGVFVWKHRDTHKDKLGKVAGIKRPNGYLAICIDSQYHYSHRLAWMYVHCDFPNVIDHIDGNKENNSINNLRSVTQKTNIENLKKARKHNSTGLLGVFRSKNKFQSRIGVNGVGIYLGRFLTKELAHEAYLQAKRKYHDGCTI